MTTPASLTFEDEFNSFQTWNGSTGWDVVGGPQWANNGRLKDPSGTEPFNNELQWYVNPNYVVVSGQQTLPDPFSVSNGVLDITAAQANPAIANYYNAFNYSSGIITSAHSLSQLYGYFEIRAEVPAGNGLFPAFWLLPADGSHAEIDIMEILGKDPTKLYTTAHSFTTGQDVESAAITTIPNAASGFHTYGVDWEPNFITWYFDGHEVFQVATPADLNKPMYMIANLAIGNVGSFPGPPDGSTSFPASLQIDYIRAFSSLPMPTVESIVANTAGPTNAATITETVTFSESVSGVVAGDFALGGTLTGDSISTVTGSGTSYTVTVATGTGNGTVQLNLNANDSGITDAAGYSASAAFTAGTVTTVQHTAPTVSSITATTDDGTDSLNAGHVVTVTVTASEAVIVTGTPALQLNDNEVATYTKGSGTSALTFSYTVQPGDDAADLQVTGLNLPNGATIKDGTGLSLSNAVTGNLGIQIDTTMTAPTNTQLVTELYVGYYDRAPDPAGLNFWVNSLNAGVPLATIANDYANSIESTSIYPFLLDPTAAGYSAFITSVYENILNRTTDAGGAAFWLNQLQTGQTTPGGFILAIEDSVNMQSGTADALTLQDKTVVGLDYVTRMADANIPVSDATAHAVLASVTSNPASVGTAEAITTAIISAGTALDYIPAGPIADGNDLAQPGLWGVSTAGNGASIPAVSTSANQSLILNFIAGTGSNANILLFPVSAWTAGSVDAGLTYGDGHTATSGPTVIDAAASAATLSAAANVIEIMGTTFSNAAALATALSTTYGLTFAGTGVAAGKDSHMLFLYNDASGNAHIADVDFENATSALAATTTTTVSHIVASDMVELVGVSASGITAANIHLV